MYEVSNSISHTSPSYWIEQTYAVHRSIGSTAMSSTLCTRSAPRFQCLSHQMKRTWCSVSQDAGEVVEEWLFSYSLNLPSANDLLQHAPSKPVWNRVVSGIVRAKAEMSLLKEVEHKCILHLLSQMDQHSRSPSALQTITHNKDLLHLTARSNFRIRLVLSWLPWA